MAIFRVEKSKDYTVMSNYHLRDGSLSLKAKGLLSQILSLPEGWDYTLTGLSEINKESKDAIRSAVQELEKAGYIVRRQTSDAGGKFSSNEYIIHEQPAEDSPLLDFPTTENPSTEKPSTENPTQLNKDILNTDISKEKNKQKRKSATQALEPMPIFKDWIADRFAQAPPDSKNRLYFALSRFVENRETLKKPIRSQGAITALTNRLLRFSQDSRDPIDAMVEMLDRSTSSSWQSVYPPGQGQKPSSPPSGRRFEEL